MGYGDLTQVVVTPVYGAVCAVMLLLFGSAMWWPSLRSRPGTKRILLVLGFVLGLCAIGLYVIGLYLPIFQVADLVSQ